MTYDAENRLISFCSDASCTQWTQFVYDAAGNRVQRMDSNATTTTFVYDAFGTWRWSTALRQARRELST